MNTNTRMKRRQASEYLREKFGADYAPATLSSMACRGDGPPFIVIGKYALYEEADLDAWIETRTKRRVTAPDQQQAS